MDGRLKEWGYGGRDIEVHETRTKELQSSDVKASQVTQQISNTPLRESNGYTADRRRKLQELRKGAHEVYINFVA